MCKQNIQALDIETCSSFTAFLAHKNECRLSYAQQADLTAASRHILDQVAKAIKILHKLSLDLGIPPLIVSVEGHTNCKDPAKRSNPYHMGLSMERANKCREYLESAGTSASKPNSDREGKL